MTESAYPVSAELEFAEHLADLAAMVTLPAFGSRLAVDRKHDNSVVTALDKAAEAALLAEVRAAFPDDGFLGEEGAGIHGTSGRTWIVDPIDGTRMYSEGVPTWSTLIALKDEHGYAVGVADSPAIGERSTAVRGGGAWLRAHGAAPRRIRVSDCATLSDALLMHASIEEFIGRDELDVVLDLVRSTRGTRTLVDAYGHTLVARGAVDAMLEALPCYEWDWAATSVIVHEAGGHVTRWQGGDPTPGDSLVVTNGLVEAELLERLAGR